MCENIKKIKFNFLFYILAALISGHFAYGQENQEVKAIQLFNSGNYKESELVLERLLEENSESPILNYYYGASRTENGNYGRKELEYLNQAGKNITPDRLYYYQAIQYHALESWDKALKLYNQFRVSVPENEQDELDLHRKIQLCYNQVNPFDTISDTAVLPEAETPTGIEGEISETGNIDQYASENEPGMLTASSDSENILPVTESFQNDNLVLHREVLPDLPGVKPTLPDGDPVQFQVNNAITYLFTSQFQTTEGKNLFEKASSLQHEQERKLEEADSLRKAYSSIHTAAERDAIASRIIALENESFYLDEQIKKTYSEARKVENDYWENADAAFRNNFLLSQEKIISSLDEDNQDTREPEEEIIIGFIEPAPKAPAKVKAPELVYKIQIGAYSKGVPAYKQRLFKKLSVIRTIDNYTDEKGVVVYTTGNLTRYEDALLLRNQVRQEGIQDAAVVPYFKGKRITLEEAKQLEENNDI